jgi:hypothetical protein
VQKGAIRADRLTGAFLEGAEKLRAIGGLAVIAVHTQIVGTGRRLDAIRAVADTALAQGDWWIAEAVEVANWWKARSGVRVTAVHPRVETIEADSLGARTLDIRVAGPAGESITGLWIDIVLPRGSDAVTPAVDGVPVDYTTTDWGIRVPLGDLPDGETRLISLQPRFEDGQDSDRRR